MSREQKYRVDFLSMLASTKRLGHNCTILKETSVALNIEEKKTNNLEVVMTTSWMAPIICYLLLNKLPSDELEVKKI